MNKKTLKVTLMKGVAFAVVIGLAISNVRLGNMARVEIDNLKNSVEELETNVEEKQQQVDNLQEQLAESKKEIKEAIEARENVETELEKEKERYDNLNKKYQEEISPVVFNQSNLLTSSNCNTRKLSKALQDTGLAGLEEAYINAEQEYGVNAIFLVSLTAEESAWGTSNRARTQNNMSGFEVYSAGATGAYFDTKRESILTTAKLLSRDYLTAGGIYHSGFTIQDVNKRYCPNDDNRWSRNITTIANQIVEKINS